MRRSLHLALAAAAISLVGAVPALAASTGLENIHTLRREHGRLCMADHFHYGHGESKAGLKQAKAAAMRAWADFVQVEYGSDWSRFNRAANRSVACDETYGNHTCNVSGRPCRR